MNHFLLSSEERLKCWRKMRLELLRKDLSDLDHLKIVAEWWAKCPISYQRTIDPYSSENWPSGWELIHDGNFCRSLIGLGMEQSLLLREGRWNSDRIKLSYIDDNKEMDYLAPIVDDTYILNYSLNEVVLLNEIENITIIYQYYFDGKNHIQI